MENIKKQQNMEIYIFICYILCFLIVLFQSFYQNHLLSHIVIIFMLFSAFFYYKNKKMKDKQFDYLIQCCEHIVE